MNIKIQRMSYLCKHKRNRHFCSRHEHCVKYINFPSSGLLCIIAQEKSTITIGMFFFQAMGVASLSSRPYHTLLLDFFDAWLPVTTFQGLPANVTFSIPFFVKFKNIIRFGCDNFEPLVHLLEMHSMWATNPLANILINCLSKSRVYNRNEDVTK